VVNAMDPRVKLNNIIRVISLYILTTNLPAYYIVQILVQAPAIHTSDLVSSVDRYNLSAAQLFHEQA
jgi:hypothetical protein